MVGLFDIAPLLNRGFQTVRFDPYERVLIAKIRSGRYSSDLWDCNSLYLDYEQRIGAPAYQQVEESKKSKREVERLNAYLREVMAEEDQERLARKAALEASRAEREARKAERERRQRAWEEEQERVAREEAAKQAERTRRRAEQDAAWKARAAEIEAERDAERAAILAAPWQCKKCLGRAEISQRLGRYQVMCAPCAFSSVGDHETLIKLVEAQAA